ncbi:Cytochrome P450 704C1 [Diplonema papillatum]|nr:Cytochrome P450 704C1 [Diplonema papillatum]KAJ9456295.1 Cytochrome P450 704C1 [Diplonema papillatum]
MWFVLVSLTLVLTSALLWMVSAGSVKGVPNKPGSETFFGITRHVLQCVGSGRQPIYEWVLEGFQLNDWKPFAGCFLGGKKIVFIIDVDDFKCMMKDKFYNFSKGYDMYAVFNALLGSGIFVSDGPEWKKQRIVSAHMFNRRQLRDRMSNVFGVHAQQLCDLMGEQAAKGEPLEMQKYFYHFTFDCINSIAFNRHVNSLSQNPEDCAFQDAFDACAMNILTRAITPWWKISARFQLSAAEREFSRNIKKVNEYVYRVVDDYIDENGQIGEQTVANDQTLTGLFLQHAEDDPELTMKSGLKKFVRDMILNFVIAGRDTTGAALTSCIDFLVRPEHIHWQQALQNEAVKCFGDNAKTEPLTFDDIEGKSTVSEAIFMEALRLHPSVPGNEKLCEVSTTFPSGVSVPKGTFVSWQTFSMNRNERVWGPDATVFKPERWIKEDNTITSDFNEYMYPTFNAGPRLCLGKSMAILEGKIALLTIFARLRFERIPGFTPKQISSVTWQLDANGMQVKAYVSSFSC